MGEVRIYSYFSGFDLSSRFQITEDDIRVGSSADIKWTRKGVEDVFPALLLKTRVQKGQLQYKYVPI